MGCVLRRADEVICSLDEDIVARVKQITGFESSMKLAKSIGCQAGFVTDVDALSLSGLKQKSASSVADHLWTYICRPRAVLGL
jgi:hypothetical protein